MISRSAPVSVPALHQRARPTPDDDRALAATLMAAGILAPFYALLAIVGVL